MINRRTLISAFLLLSTLTVFFTQPSAREHEHLPYFFSGQGYMEVVGEPTSQMKLSQFFSKAEKFTQFCKTFGVENLALNGPFENQTIDTAFKALLDQMKSKTIQQGGQVVKAYPQLQSLQTGTDLFIHGMTTESWVQTGMASANEQIYREVENLRKGALKYLVSKGNSDSVERLFVKYLESLDPLDRQRIVFAVPQEYLDDPTMKAALQKFKAATAGTSEVRYLYSIARNSGFDADEVAKAIEKIKANPTLIDGIDVTGSLLEGEYLKKTQNIKPGAPLPPQNVARFEKNKAAFRGAFDALFKQSPNHSSIRLHIFEGMPAEYMANDPFYSALKDSLAQLKNNGSSLAERNITIRVGHIRTLDVENPFVDAMLKDFGSQVDKGNLIFEANFRSNEYVKGAQGADLAKRIKAVLGRGYGVVLGSDGIGMLPRNDLASTVFDLAQAMDEKGHYILSETDLDNLLKKTTETVKDSSIPERQRKVLVDAIQKFRGLPCLL